MFHSENLQFCFSQGYLQRMDGIFEYLEKHTCWSHLNIKKKKRNLCLCFLGDTYETMNDEWYIIMYGATVNRASVVAQLVKNPPAMQEIWVWSLGWEDPLKKRKATHLSILNSMDRRVHRVTKSWTQLSDFHFIHSQQAHENMLNITNHRENASHNCDMTSNLSEWLSLETQKITSVAEDVEKRESLRTVSGNVNTAATTENDVELPQKTVNRITYDSAIPLLGIYREETKRLIQKHICSPMFMAASFTIVKIWKQPKCPLTDW